MEIWVNPACSKCRAAVAQLDEAGARYTVRRYLDDPPDAGEIADVLGRLGLEPWDITRTGEALAKELDLASWPRDVASRSRWIDLLVAHPTLLQRPIITAEDGTAVVGRTADAVADALSREGP
jgi:arsenate reductase (glutaredoxin)